MTLCTKCEIRPAIKSGKDKNGNQLWKHLCGKCRYKQEGREKRYSYDKATKYRLLTGMTCTRCGFVAENICQMDGHHVDGDHSNNEDDNLQTLCANCHRLIHHLARIQ